MIRMYLENVGLRAPGLDGWTTGSEVLAGRVPYTASPIVVPECRLLPPAERRRAVPNVKLALAVADEAAPSADGKRPALATIFASSAGDSRTLHEILQVLASPERDVSPTRFHNSVHNAPAGYWHIASGCHEASTSISCYDGSFAAGLLEAAAQIATEGQPLLLVAYDLPFPAPLDLVRPIGSSFGAALHLTAEATPRSLVQLDVQLVRSVEPPTRMEEPALEHLRIGNPAARSLPLLKLVAEACSGIVHLEYTSGYAVQVSITSLKSGHARRDGAVAAAAAETANA